MTAIAQLRTFAPSSAPGALYRRVTAGDTVLREGPMDLLTAGSISVADRDFALAYAEKHGVTVWVHIYDGDTGECGKTIIVHPEMGELIG